VHFSTILSEREDSTILSVREARIFK